MVRYDAVVFDRGPSGRWKHQLATVFVVDIFVKRVSKRQPVDVLLTNVHLATMTDGYGEMRDAAIAVKDGRIAWLGRAPMRRTRAPSPCTTAAAAGSRRA
jgi:hypothetical protein